MKLSICTPTWNRESSLSRTLRQTALQIETDYLQNDVEVCLSDNGSTDKTQDVIESIRREFPRVTFRVNQFETNQGFARNLDATVKLANGEFLFFNGDDDCFRPNGVSELLGICLNTKNVLFLKNLWDFQGTMDWDSLETNQQILFPDVYSSLLALGSFHPSFIGNFMVRREAYLSHSNRRFLESIYPHMAVTFEVLRNSPVEFRNFTCIEVDDSNRRVGACSARGTAVDAARVQTEGHLLKNRNWQGVFRFYKTFLRSIPRAILNERTGECRRLNNEYANTSLFNLLDVYRASYLAMFVGALLFFVARFSPCWLLRSLLR